MGFSDYFIQTVTTDNLATITKTAATATAAAENTETDAADGVQKSDQEILESIEECYYSADSNPELYELKVGIDIATNSLTSNCESLYRKYLAMALITSLLRPPLHSCELSKRC